MEEILQEDGKESEEKQGRTSLVRVFEVLSKFIPKSQKKGKLSPIFYNIPVEGEERNP